MKKSRIMYAHAGISIGSDDRMGLADRVQGGYSQPVKVSWDDGVPDKYENISIERWTSSDGIRKMRVGLMPLDCLDSPSSDCPNSVVVTTRVPRDREAMLRESEVKEAYKNCHGPYDLIEKLFGER